MKSARTLCSVFCLLFPFVLLLVLLIFLPACLSGRAEDSSADGPILAISSIRGILEDGRPSSIFVVLQNNASPTYDTNYDPVEPGFDKNSARNIQAELESVDEKIKIFSGQQNAGLLVAGENATVQFMALAEGASLGIYPLKLRLNYSSLSQVTVSGSKAAPNFVFVYERASQDLPLQVKVVQGPRIEQEELEGDALLGGQSSLGVVLANWGDQPALDIQMQARPVAPFLMIENSQENVSLAPGESATLKLSIFTDQNATSGYYALPCRISYRDGQNGELKSQDLALLICVSEQSSIPWLYLGAAGLILLLLVCGIFGLRRFMSGQRRIRIVKS